ncbi:hypothetical protein DK880_00920 [Candidatus Cardinium hertigii]|uniref:Uncharacterized protein n=1 Tax=Candidatus Cardinium hertigii TaxID=247481 RepID=A0A2Z3L9M3_9BACT|nr:hypothetical protein DK880_00920 [Candidatus Cardinium hertigii]
MPVDIYNDLQLMFSYMPKRICITISYYAKAKVLVSQE